MGKVKEFWQKHKTKVYWVGGTLVAVGAATWLILKDRTFMEITGRHGLAWDPPTGSMNLEEVKSILDVNADNSAKFAIFREGLEPDKYVAIFMDDKMVFPDEICELVE